MHSFGRDPHLRVTHHASRDTRGGYPARIRAHRAGHRTSEFAAQAKAFRQLGQIDNFVFVLDGDKEEERTQYEEKIHQAAGKEVPVLFLPGRVAPEVWVWRQLAERCEAASGELGVTADTLRKRMNQFDAIYDAASDPASEIAKNKQHELAQALGRNAPEICRIVARIQPGHILFPKLGYAFTYGAEAT